MLTDICDPPDDWGVVSLRDLVESGKVELGRGNVISKKEMRSKPGNYPVYSSSVTNNGKIGEYGEYMFDEEMITWSVDGGGHLFYRPKHKFSVTNIGGYIRLHTDEIDYRWLHGLLSLQHEHITFDYQLKAHPSVIKDIYQVFDVPIEEQRRIADVLDTVDAAIQETDSVVEKQEQVKTGLLQDLLTRGLDADGRLRDPEREPGAFRETEFGKIPKEWRVEKLTDLASYQNGKSFPSDEYQDTPGIPLLRPGNMHKNGFVRWTERHTTYLPKKWRSEAKDYLLGGDEIVMNLTAQSLEDKFLGRVCLTPPGTDALLNQRIARFRVHGCDKHFLFWALKGPHFRDQVDRIPTGTKVQHIYNKDLDSMEVILPSRREEQEEIAKVLRTHVDEMEEERRYRDKLEQFKTGLMQDLLTGRVHVPEAEARVDEVVA